MLVAREDDRGAADAERAVSPDRLGLVLLAGAAVVIAAIVAARLAHAAGLPALLVFLGLGLALGEAGAGVRFDNVGLAEVLGLSALVLILAEGGLTTNWPHVRAAAPAALLLATAGVAVSVLVVAAFVHGLLGFSWRDALLLGSILAPTDAAAVFSVLRKLPLPPRLAGMLEGESGLNDPPAVLAVTLFSQVSPHATAALLVGEIAYQLAAGAVIGLAAGLLGALTLRRVALPASGLYPIAVLALIVASYGAASQARASGFLAVYVSAVVLGNARLPHGPATRGFAEGIGLLAQIGLFVMLGLLASPARLPAQILPGVVTGVVLVAIARPAAVLVATTPLRLPWRQQAFVSWAGLRGAVPIVLATIPISKGVPGATRLFDIVFIVAGVFTLVQGPTLPWAARRLGLISPAEPVELTVEAAPLEELHADLLQAQIPDGSRLHGVEIFELRLPAQVNLALIVREGHGFVPGPTTTLRTGDKLLLVTPVAVREQTERRLRAVSRAGKLAGWFGEHGQLPGSGPQDLQRPLGAVLGRGAVDRFVDVQRSHGPRRVADVDALGDAGQLPQREGDVEPDAGQVAAGPRRVPAHQIGGLGESRQRRGRPLPLPRERGQLGVPVSDQDAHVRQRVAQRAQLPVQDGADLAVRGDDGVVQPVVAVHDRGARLGGNPLREQGVRLVHRRDRPVHPGLPCLLLGLQELAVPAAQLPFDVAIVAAKVAEADRRHVDLVQRGQDVDEIPGRGPPGRLVQDGGLARVPQHVPFDEIHDIERPARHRLVSAEPQDGGDRHGGGTQRGDDAVLPRHVVGRGQHVAHRRAAQHHPPAGRVGHRVRQVGPAAGDEVKAERCPDAADAGRQPAGNRGLVEPGCRPAHELVSRDKVTGPDESGHGRENCSVRAMNTRA